jgi:isopenicillin N synthase-like dioxygenase
MENTVVPFVRKGLEVSNVVLNIFNDKLGLPKGTLEKLHDMEEYSGSETRCIRSPPAQVKEATKNAVIGAHTDFGSLVGIWTHWTCLFNQTLPELLAQSPRWTPSAPPGS